MVTRTHAPAHEARALLGALAAVTDPELPMLTLADLGVLRGVEADEAARHARVRITPTYTGCPAMEVMKRSLEYAGTSRGWSVEVVVELSPPWSSNDITEAGRRALAEAGIAPPRPVLDRSGGEHGGPVPVALSRRPAGTRPPDQGHTVACPLCGAEQTEVLSEFGSTACKQLRRCVTCREPFDAVKVH